MNEPSCEAFHGALPRQRFEMSSVTLWEQLDARRSLVDDGVAAFLDSHYDAGIRDIIGYVSLGGKRLRGILALLICEALQGLAADALPAAVAVELAHAASLVHDDIIDADIVRRGQPALHVRYDLATAILVPHLIVPQAILSAGVYGPPAIRMILQGWARVTRGQVSDSIPLGFEDGVDRPMHEGADWPDVESEYLAIIRDKTASLFETAAALGALAAGNEPNATVAPEYAASLGTAFQIADDVTDLERHAGQAWSALLAAPGARSLRALRRMVSGANEERITASAIERATRLAAQHVGRCVGYSEMFPASRLRDTLGAFPAIAVEQIYREARDASSSGARLPKLSLEGD